MRDLDLAIEDRLDDPFILPVIFVELQFDDGTLFLHTDLGTIGPYVGTGSLGSVGAIEETDGVEPFAVEMTLSGLDSDLLNEARGQQYQDRIVRILVGIRDTLTGVMVSAPEEIFYGYMDQMVIVSGRETAAISLRAESEQARWRRLATRFYDDVTLQSTYSGDLFFKYLPDMTHLQLKWGMDNPGVTIGNSNESSFWKTG